MHTHGYARTHLPDPLLPHRFHGKDPSKNKKEKRIQRYQEDQKVKRAAASVQPASSTERLQTINQASATPYLVLNGNANGRGAPASSGRRDPEKQVALTPVLGGRDTPLTGDKKVAAMLGINSRGDESMRPPPPRQNVRK